MSLILIAIMFILSAVMFVAAWQGITFGLNLNTVIALFIAIILTIVAVYGAVSAWHWPICGAI